MSNIYENKAKKLFAIWFVSYVALNVFSSIYIFYEKIANNYNPITMLSGYQIFSLIVMVFYFLPVIFYVARFAKLAEMKKLHIAAQIIFSFIAIWSICLFSFTILALLVPDLF